jgi:hypothetical protein
MALAIAWQGVADSRKRRFNPEMAKLFVEANSALTGSGWRSGSDAEGRLPSEYPQAGLGGNPWHPQRWSH